MFARNVINTMLKIEYTHTFYGDIHGYEMEQTHFLSGTIIKVILVNTAKYEWNGHAQFEKIQAELTFKLLVETPDPQFNFDS